MEMLVTRGVRINATNMGDDTALHLAAAHNHRDIVFLVCSQLSFSRLTDGNTSIQYCLLIYRCVCNVKNCGWIRTKFLTACGK